MFVGEPFVVRSPVIFAVGGLSDADLGCRGIGAVAAVVYVYSASFGEGYAVADLDAGFCDLGDVGDIVVLLQGCEDGLDSFHVAVQLCAERLQLLDALLVVAELLPDFVQVGAGDC